MECSAKDGPRVSQFLDFVDMLLIILYGLRNLFWQYLGIINNVLNITYINHPQNYACRLTSNIVDFSSWSSLTTWILHLSLTDQNQL